MPSAAGGGAGGSLARSPPLLPLIRLDALGVSAACVSLSCYSGFQSILYSSACTVATGSTDCLDTPSYQQ